MRVKGKQAANLGQHAIFGDEEAATLRADVDELRATMAELTDRLHSQFTTISAHAEIARNQVELARDEARADLERTRERLLGLIEHVRAEATPTTPAPFAAPSPSAEPQHQRLDLVEAQIGQLGETVERCFRRQNELADTMAAFLDTMLAEQRGEPVAGLALG